MASNLFTRLKNQLKPLKKKENFPFVIGLIGLFFLFFLPPTDPDLGWQLQCGKQIWQMGKICYLNTFSVFLPNYPWSHSNTLYQISLYPFYRFLGLPGLSFYNSLLVAASFFIFFLLAGQKTLRLILLPLVIYLSWGVFSFGIRGQVTSLFYFLLLLLVFEKSKQNIKAFFFSPLILFLWANSHGSFVVGIVMLALFFLEKTLFAFKEKKISKNYSLYAVFCFLALAVTLVNPFGLKIYEEAWRHFHTVALSKLIAEWVPPTSFYRLFVYLFLALGLYLLALIRKEPLSLFKTFLLVGLAYLAIKARRNLTYFFIFGVYVLSFAKEKFLSHQRLETLSLLVALFLFVYGFFYQFPKTLLLDTSWPKYCLSGQVEYPCAAVEFLKKQPAGNLFNRYEWGGFLIWQLPQDKIFVDGRMPAWKTPSGKSPYTVFLDTYLPQVGWQETLKQYNIKWILVSPYGYLGTVLQSDPTNKDWEQVYLDQVAIVFKRR